MVARANIGLKRIHRSRRASEASVTRDVRAQFKEVMQNLNKIIQAIEGATPKAIEYASEPILERSLELVPRDTEALANSAYLEVQGNTVEIGYAKGGNPYYAVFVHEDMEAYHKPPTQAKFLQQAVNEQLGEIEPRIRDYLEGFISG